MAQQSGANGFFTGLFFLIFNFNAIIGNLIVLGSAAADMSMHSLLVIMTIIAAAGAAMLVFTPAAPAPQTSAAGAISGPAHHATHMSLGAWMRQVWAVWQEPWTKLLAGYMAQQGVGLAFSFAVLPKLTPGSTQDIGLLFLSYGVAGCLASMVCGRLFDKWGWPWVIGLHVSSTLTVYLLVLAVYFFGLNYHVHILSAAIFSLVDNCSNSICNMTISEVITLYVSPSFLLPALAMTYSPPPRI
jgi:hypothetical protein